MRERACVIVWCALLACGSEERSSTSPGFQFRVTSFIVAVPRGGSTAATIELHPGGGFKGRVTIRASGPGGITADPLNIPPEETGGRLVIHASPDGPLSPRNLARA